MTTKKPTHNAAATIQYQDEKGGTVEIKKGDPIPGDFDADEFARLEKNGHIVPIKGDSNNDGVPDGYAAGTQPASAGGGLTGDENAVLDVQPTESSTASSSEANANAPALGNRGTGGTRGTNR